MPPVQVAKSSRSSAFSSMTKKRSASPSAQQPSETKSKLPPPPPLASSSSSSSSNPPPRRTDEGPYFEMEYRSEIVEYMTSMDNNTIASAELMDMQPELQWFMRPYLIDFLIEVHQQFRLRPEVLYLAMNIVDRYVSKRVVYKKHYQLVGCAALWIAAKFEDGKDKVPLVKELADMCCKAYDESAFIQMEGHVLSTIGWVIGHPSAEAWLRLYTTGEYQEEQKIQHTARFLMEITLFHREFVGIQSHFIAAGALMLARFICGKPKKSFGTYENISARIAFAIDKHFSEKMETVSEIVIRKYAPMYYSRCSTVVREWYLGGRRFAYSPDIPRTPAPPSMHTPGLAPSGSWSGKRNSWMSASPSAGSMSCASSDAGDEPITPLTPVHSHEAGGYPFTASSSSKENIAPQVYSASNSSTDLSSHNHQQHHMVGVKQHLPENYGHAGHPRSALHPIVPTVTELSIPNRTMRRLSN